MAKIFNIAMMGGMAPGVSWQTADETKWHCWLEKDADGDPLIPYRVASPAPIGPNKPPQPPALYKKIDGGSSARLRADSVTNGPMVKAALVEAERAGLWGKFKAERQAKIDAERLERIQKHASALRAVFAEHHLIPPARDEECAEIYVKLRGAA